MNKPIKMLAVIFLLFLNNFTVCGDLGKKNPKELIGIFKKNHPCLNGIKWGNWGSRPFEYHWASEVVSVANKRVIDLGVGLPSQYNWYEYVINKLRPTYYCGIDADGRMIKEIMHGSTFDMLHMDMSKVEFSDKSFDVAYCISTFEHIPFDVFMKCIQEAHRILKDDGILVITLDEQWDKNIPLNPGTSWNTLEQSLIENGSFERKAISFGLPHFLMLIQDYFAPVIDVKIDSEKQIIYGASGEVYYQRANRDTSILYSPEYVNSCVSYAVLRKK